MKIPNIVDCNSHARLARVVQAASTANLGTGSRHFDLLAG